MLNEVKLSGLGSVVTIRSPKLGEVSNTIQAQL